MNGEIILHHGEFMPSTVRQMLSSLWTKFDAATRAALPAAGSDDFVVLLARLDELRSAGVLTDEEFAAKKLEILARI
ncbi:MAG TPA: SHOCT domain-containing protein [Solirubrobacteraceae bacterium]|nr:SHOCT domain-containing protein [Solirubrobacteraceae bacterium]